MFALLRQKSMKLVFCLSLCVLAVTGAAFASGEGSTPTVATVRAATVSELTTIQQELLQLISSILPVALVVMGSILVVTLGIRLFRRFAG